MSTFILLLFLFRVYFFRIAKCSAEIVKNGTDRGEENCWIGKKNDIVEYKFDFDTKISEIRLVFDSDLNRDYHNMPCNYPLVQNRFKLPKTLIKEYKIEGISKNEKINEIHITDNHQRFIKHIVNWNVDTIRLVPISTFGSEELRIFDFEIN